MLKGSTSLKAALRRRKGEPKGTGGVGDRGAAEEDGPVTWETPVRPFGSPGNGGPETPSDAPSASSGPAAGLRGSDAGRHRTYAWANGKAWPREDRRRAEATGESDGRVRAMKVGNRRGTGTQRSKGGQCWAGLQEGNMTLSTD